MSDDDGDDLLTPRETARLLGVSEATLSTWRHRRLHLSYHKMGRKVLYLREEVQAFRQRRLRDGRREIKKGE